MEKIYGGYRKICRAGKKDNTMHALDTTGLSDRVFDVFAATAKRGYLFLCNMKTNVSRWSRRAMADFDMPGEYMYDAGAIWEKRYIRTILPCIRRA